MEKERPFHKWASDETNFFCEISCEQFYGNLERERESAKKAFSSELFDSIIAEFKEGLENVQFNEKNKNFKAKKKETKLVVKVVMMHFST